MHRVLLTAGGLVLCWAPHLLPQTPKIPPFPQFDPREQAKACIDASREKFGEAHIITDAREAPKYKNSIRPGEPPIAERKPSGVFWAGQVLVGPDGKVVEVWPVSVPEERAAGPLFSRSILEAVRKASYESLKRDGKPVPFCMLATYISETR